MDYELAKQLKDAGFPQKEPNGFSGIVAHLEGVADDTVYYPTLSELIEACSAFGSFYLCHVAGDLHWHAAVGDIEITPTKVRLPAPDEVVARLWLALNNLTV